MKNRKQKIPKKITKAGVKKNVAKLRRKALKLWTDIVQILGGHQCAICGTKHGTLNKNGRPLWINAHHIEDKCNYSTRWDPKNGICLCPNCHKFCNPDSAHRSPVWFLNWLSKNRPGIIEYLLVARKTHPLTALGWSGDEMVKVVADLEAQLAILTPTPAAIASPPDPVASPEPPSASEVQEKPL